MRMVLRSSTYTWSDWNPRDCLGRDAYFIIQARPETVVDVPTSPLFDDQPAKTTLESLYAVVDGYTRGCREPSVSARGGRRAKIFAGATLPIPVAVRSLMLMLLDLRIETRHDAFEASQPIQEFCVWWSPGFARRTARPWEDAFDVCADAIRTRIRLVTLDLAPTTSSTGPKARNRAASMRRGCATSVWSRICRHR